MSTTFRKGDRVAVLSSWDNKGRVRIRRATVHSCGTKVMRLQDAGGEMFKIAYRPENAVMAAFNGLLIVPDAPAAQLEQLALESGQKIIRENLERRRQRVVAYKDGRAYVAHMTAEVEELERSEPSYFWAG